MNDSNDNSTQEDVKVPLDIEIENHSPNDSLDTSTIQPIQFITVTPTQGIEETSTNDNDEPASGNKTTIKILSDLVALQKEDRDDTMGNKKFLLSLLPFMKKLPDDVNLEVRLQLLSVLQTYTVKQSTNT